MSRLGLQPLGVEVSFFGNGSSFQSSSPRKQFTERIIHYPLSGAIITIEGGRIDATGGTCAYTESGRPPYTTRGAAGIGGAAGRGCYGTIRIYDGDIKATGAEHAAGIGSGAVIIPTKWFGMGCNNGPDAVGVVSVQGGTIEATGGGGTYLKAAGIGSGGCDDHPSDYIEVHNYLYTPVAPFVVKGDGMNSGMSLNTNIFGPLVLNVGDTKESATRIVVEEGERLVKRLEYGYIECRLLAMPPVEVQPNPAENTTLGGVYTNGVAIMKTEDKYMVEQGAAVDVVFQGNTGYFFLTDGTYASVATNTVTATSDPTPVAGPAAVAGTRCGGEGVTVYGFMDAGGALTLVGTGATASGSKNNPFRGDSLTSVVIQPGVTEIGQFFFKNCTHLNSVTGGKDLATVGNQAFFGCMSLEAITLDGNMPAGMDNAVVYKTAIKPSGETYDIPDIKVKNYVKALFGAKDAKNPEWVNLGSPENQSIYASEYSFFQIRLVPVAE